VKTAAEVLAFVNGEVAEMATAAYEAWTVHNADPTSKDAYWRAKTQALKLLALQDLQRKLEREIDIPAPRRRTRKAG